MGRREVARDVHYCQAQFEDAAGEPRSVPGAKHTTNDWRPLHFTNAVPLLWILSHAIFDFVKLEAINVCCSSDGYGPRNELVHGWERDANAGIGTGWRWSHGWCRRLRWW